MNSAESFFNPRRGLLSSRRGLSSSRRGLLSSRRELKNSLFVSHKKERGFIIFRTGEHLKIEHKKTERPADLSVHYYIYHLKELEVRQSNP